MNDNILIKDKIIKILAEKLSKINCPEIDCNLNKFIEVMRIDSNCNRVECWITWAINELKKKGVKQ